MNREGQILLQFYRKNNMGVIWMSLDAESMYPAFLLLFKDPRITAIILETDLDQ